jgi:hypothetical protein
MPAVQWKLANIVKLKTQNPEKHKAQGRREILMHQKASTTRDFR